MIPCITSARLQTDEKEELLSICWKKYIETINLEIQNVEQGCEYDGGCGYGRYG